MQRSVSALMHACHPNFAYIQPTDGLMRLFGMLQVLTDHTEEVWHIQFSHNGRWLASASKDCTAIVWEVVSGSGLQKRHTFQGHSMAVTFCCWSPCDTMLATCSLDGLVKIWDVHLGCCSCTIDLHQGATFTASWHPDGELQARGATSPLYFFRA